MSSECSTTEEFKNLWMALVDFCFGFRNRQKNNEMYKIELYVSLPLFGICKSTGHKCLKGDKGS